MEFEIEITNISTLTKTQLHVVEGKILKGSVLPGAQVELIHQGKRIPLTIFSVVLGLAKYKKGTLHLTVSRDQKAMEYASVGDKLIHD